MNTLSPRQKDSLRVLRNKLARKLALAMTSMAYMKGTNANTVRELRAQIESLDIITN
jgi:hypothetical protein